MLGYFNSRPSARGDNRNDNGIAVCRISIHAPPRGATVRMLTLLAVTTFQFTPLREGRHPPRPEEPGGVKISIHAPPRGATTASTLTVEPQNDFNSRPSARGDGAYGQNRYQVGISIHAPPRGATGWRRGQNQQERDFNSRPSARGDVAAALDALAADLFQFTPLREGRQPAAARSPAPPEISIHAPPRGATQAIQRGRLKR